MTISRRKFAQKAGLTIAGAAVAGAASNVFSQSLRSGKLFSISPEAYGERVMSFNSETFRSLIGTIFRSRLGDGPGNSLRLADIGLPRSSTGKFAATGDSFSLFFRGVGPKNVSQEIHTFEHPSLGTFSLFIAPVDRSGKTYEAVINHSPAL